LAQPISRERRGNRVRAAQQAAANLGPLPQIRRKCALMELPQPRPSRAQHGTGNVRGPERPVRRTARHRLAVMARPLKALLAVMRTDKLIRLHLLSTLRVSAIPAPRPRCREPAPGVGHAPGQMAAAMQAVRLIRPQRSMGRASLTPVAIPLSPLQTRHRAARRAPLRTPPTQPASGNGLVMAAAYPPEVLRIVLRQNKR
jgi:hypothetical protein